ncbi:hypothetical protein [uncultured Gimesia sp.]|uniref:hypothetical protein n=1 Tax=uncultured Gimesia sp. TaxID=1678688 RepID=UPI0030D8D1A9|tara:strand:- start:875 stop:1162 length:288 start_codon:yes stop_codon:yes gene_type:complete
MKNEEEKYFNSKNFIFSAYTPAVSCAMLALIFMMGTFLTMGNENAMLSVWSMLFCLSLPGCFMFYAYTMHTMIRKVREQQLQIDALQQQQGSIQA